MMLMDGLKRMAISRDESHSDNYSLQCKGKSWQEAREDRLDKVGDKR